MRSEPATPTNGTVPSRLAAVRLAAVMAMGSLIGLKMLASYDPLPGWGADPTLHDAALRVSISPDLHVAINAGITLFAGLILSLAGAANSSRVAANSGTILLAVSLGSLLYHTAFNRAASVEDWTAGSDLIAAACAGAACFSLPRATSPHRAMSALLCGVVIAVAAKGTLQYFVEHGQTVRAYLESRDQILAANGWAPGSPSALAYERRLFQREPTGWFGLSNIFASVTGAGAVALAGLALVADSRPARAVLGISAVFAGVVVALTLSKGGLVATGVGIVVLVLLWWHQRRTCPADPTGKAFRIASAYLPWIFVGLAILGQAAIVLRGMMGTRIPELSLLFRWFYIQGAAKIYSNNPVAGVGPAGFKDAYLLAKPPISPEDVASPHSLPWDFASTLGLGGLALTALWLSWVWMTGRGAIFALQGEPHTARAPAEATRDDRDVPTGVQTRLLALAVAAAVISSVWIEKDATSPEIAAMKLFGLAAWLAVSLAAWGALRSAAAYPLAAMAAVLVLHAQVEMTPVWIGSGAWFMAIIGLAASTGSTPQKPTTASEVPERTASLQIASRVAVLSLVAACLFAMVARAGILFNWTSLLHRSAERVLGVTRLFSEIDRSLTLREPADRDQSIRDALTRHGLSSETPFPDRGLSLDDTLRERCLDAWERSLADLLVASSILQRHGPTRRAASSLAIRLAEIAPEGSQQERFIRVALDEADAAATAPRQRAVGLAWAATARLALAERGLIGPQRAVNHAAIDLLAMASAADPFNHQHPARIARLMAAEGREQEARSWADRALQLDRAASLDPLRRMDDASRRDMETISSRSTGAGGP